MSKNWISILTLFGLFAGCTAVTYGAGKAVISIIASIKSSSRNNNTGDPHPNDNTKIIDEDPEEQSDKEFKIPIPVNPLILSSCSVRFDYSTRKYSLTPEVEAPPQRGLVFELYKDESAKDILVASSTEKNPDKILSVKQSEKPYYLVAIDTVSRRRSEPFKIEDCKPQRIRKEELESAINKGSWEAFQKNLKIYKAISERCVVYRSGSRMKEVGTNAIFVIFRTVKSSADEGHRQHIYITNLKPGTEDNDYRITEIHYDEN